MRYTPVQSVFFKRNRSAFIKQMKPNAMAVFFSNDLMPRTGDTFYPYRQNSNFYYLSGIDQEDCCLILFPDFKNEAHKEILFLKETNESIAIWEGEKINKLQGKKLSGISHVEWTNSFENIFSYLVNFAESVYINLNENDRFTTKVDSKDLRFSRVLRHNYPGHKILRSTPILSQLRAIKQDEEIKVMQHAANITEVAFREVLSSIKPGMKEYEIEAIVSSSFIKQAANGHAYEPIIASGANACILHYIKNNSVCKNGDLVLFDFGAEYGNYAADLSRTIPVNGTFSKRQKEVYTACLNIHKEAKKMAKAGETLMEFNAEIKKIMTSALIDIGLIKPKASKEEKSKLTQVYFPHSTSHFMGLDVHDVGFRYEKMKNNMCITIEPGIYIREEGIGIRIENDIILRKEGNLDLMKNIPVEVDEIESLMN